MTSEHVQAFGACSPTRRARASTAVLARTATESASLAFWLAGNGIGVRARVARSMACRMNGAARMEEALDSMGGPRPGEQRSEYGELRDYVSQDAAARRLTLAPAGRSWQYCT